MKILAFVSLGEWNPESPASAIKNPLIRRAREFADRTDADIHLVHVSDDTFKFSNDTWQFAEMNLLRQTVFSDKSAWLENMSKHLSQVSPKVTWQNEVKPLKIETLLSVIESEAPDIVFMESVHHNFFVGLFSNLEWELIRQSPVPVWFVHNKLEPMDSILSAIDFVADDGSTSEDMARTALDYQVFDYSKKIASLYHAKLKIVHAIPRPGWIQPLMQTSPVALSGPLSLSANFSQEANEIQKEYERNIIDSHHNAIDAFATYFGQSASDVVTGVGQPSEVINEEAVKQQAGLIIMGATNLGRWERVISSPNAEPTLANAQCDVLFINKNSQLPSLEADEVPLLTEVIANPNGHFDDPAQLETDQRYSRLEKRRILRSWIYDQKQLLIAGDEGMPTTATLLPELESLIERIELEPTRSGEHGKTTNANGQ